MHGYEVAVIVNPNLSEEELNAEYEKIQEYIGRYEGSIDKVDNWGKRKLAYEIQKLTEGYYCFYTVNAPATFPREMENRLRIRENVIRFLITRTHE